MYAQKAIPFEDYETGRCFLRHGEITGTPASLMDLYSGLKRKTPSGTATRRLRTGSLSKQRKSCGPATSVSIGRKRQKIVNKPLEEKPRIDQFLARILRAHQLEAVNFFWRIMTGQEPKMDAHGGRGAILADVMIVT